ncbi:MAG: four helix bundle protein [Planctomycetota bacterium]|nr:MAG: four helix bundle protein [Planctomycetota bacterium]
MGKINHFKELRVWQAAFELAMEIFEISKKFPPEEKYSLTDQIRRSSRSVAANIAEAWRKRRYKAAFISKLNDSESEAAETETWIEIAVRCKYLDSAIAAELSNKYEHVCSQLVIMINKPEDWIIGESKK